MEIMREGGKIEGRDKSMGKEMVEERRKINQYSHERKIARQRGKSFLSGR